MHIKWLESQMKATNKHTHKKSHAQNKHGDTIEPKQIVETSWQVGACKAGSLAYTHTHIYSYLLQATKSTSVEINILILCEQFWYGHIVRVPHFILI